MPYLRTKMSTDFQPKSLGDRVVGALLFFIPRANPDYEPKLHLVREWLVEFDQDGRPDREVGLDAIGSPIVAGPNRRNYGFWLDTNMLFKDFAGEPVTKELFEAQWSRFHAKDDNGGVVPVA